MSGVSAWSWSTAGNAEPVLVGAVLERAGEEEGGKEGDCEHSSRIEISKMLESVAAPRQREVHVELL